jgi:Uma2 family endonuclease
MAVDTLVCGDPMSSVTTRPAVTIRRFTRDEYERMVEAGLFGPEEHLELVDGEVVETTAQGSRHATAIRLVEKALAGVFGAGFDIRVQMPVALDEYSEPEPDLAVVRGEVRDYRDAHPTRALLVVEVADKTLAFARGRKLALYARCGVPEVWIVNLVEAVVEVHRDPAGSRYGTRLRLESGDTVSPSASPEAQIAVADLLP